MHLTSETKILLGILAATVALMVGAILFFTRPTPPQQALSRTELITKSTHTRGSASASAYLVEFSDFQCPACKSAKPVVDDIIATYGDTLQFAYRHFPLSQHPYGMSAAVAAEAAGRQGKFWEMYGLLFSDQENLSDALVAGYARELKLDKIQFDRDLTDPTIKDIVQTDSDYGSRIGINATPTFYLNGVKLRLASFSDLKQKVADALQ